MPIPLHPLKDVKKLLREPNSVSINPNAVSDAWDDFGWRPEEIKKCLLKLNDKDHSLNKEENHFYKTARHHKIRNAMVDVYKAKNIMEGADVYTHIYIHPTSGMLIVNSFHKLD